MNLVGPTEKEYVAEGTVAAIANLEVVTAAHEIGQEAAENGTSGIVDHVPYHGFAVTTVETDGVVVVVVEEMEPFISRKGVVLLSLLGREVANERALRPVDESFLA